MHRDNIITAARRPVRSRYKVPFCFGKFEYWVTDNDVGLRCTTNRGYTYTCPSGNEFHKGFDGWNWWRMTWEILYRYFLRLKISNGGSNFRKVFARESGEAINENRQAKKKKREKRCQRRLLTVPGLPIERIYFSSGVTKAKIVNHSRMKVK